MKVLVTGSEGYIGSIMTPYFIKEGFDVTGLDTCYFAEGNLTNDILPEYPLIKKDIRDVEIDDLRNFDAIVHLAGLSNDPLGDIDDSLTLDINYEASVNLAKLAREAGVKRFIFSSSCSLYGQNDEILSENHPANPQTAYGKSKIMVEEAISKLADDNFSPVSMRNSTVYGVSPRMRFDLVVNSLIGFAKTTGKIQILGDGKPWRPLLHVKDLVYAFTLALKAEKDIIHNQVFNVGSSENNFQIMTIAKKIQEHCYPECEITIAVKESGDNRTYSVSFDKITEKLGFNTAIPFHEGIKEIAKVYDEINLTSEQFNHRLYTKLEQIKYLIDEGKIDSNLKWIS